MHYYVYVSSACIVVVFPLTIPLSPIITQHPSQRFCLTIFIVRTLLLLLVIVVSKQTRVIRQDGGGSMLLLWRRNGRCDTGIFAGQKGPGGEPIQTQEATH